MSYSSSSPSRQRRGGRNRDRSHEHGSRDQHQRQRFQRDTETFQRPKGGPQLSPWQKFLSFFGLGPKPPLRRADRPGTATPEAPAASGRPARSSSPAESRPPRDPKPSRPVIQHEVTSGRLYVSNLSYDATEADLTELFGGVGQVMSAEIVVNRSTQRSKGFAFVEMLNVDQAKRAVAELHDKEYMGRKMLVTGAWAAEAPRPADGESRAPESRSAESRPAFSRSADSRPAEGRSTEGRFSEGRSSEGRGSEGRPPRREARPVAGPLNGDVTTGIIRREALAGGVIPPAGPVTLPPAPVVAAEAAASSELSTGEAAPAPAGEAAPASEPAGSTSAA